VKYLVLLIFIFSVQFTFTNSANAEYDIRNSIVKIYTQMVSPYYSDPWTMDSAEFHTGSGCIISGNRVITNAHVIANSTLIQIRKYGEARKYTAKVKFVSHEADLAVLTVDNPSFLYLSVHSPKPRKKYWYTGSRREEIP